MTCAPNRAFWIWVICVNRILVAKVMAKILQRTQKSPQLDKIMISCQFCADLPVPGNSAPSMCNLTAQHRLTRIALHHMWEDINRPHPLFAHAGAVSKNYYPYMQMQMRILINASAYSLYIIIFYIFILYLINSLKNRRFGLCYT
jgi:hypothetical protein